MNHPTSLSTQKRVDSIQKSSIQLVLKFPCSFKVSNPFGIAFIHCLNACFLFIELHRIVLGVILTTCDLLRISRFSFPAITRLLTVSTVIGHSYTCGHHCSCSSYHCQNAFHELLLLVIWSLVSANHRSRPPVKLHCGKLAT